MSQRHKRTVAGLSLFIIFIVCICLLALVYAVFVSTGPLGKSFPGRQFMLLLQSWSALGIALKALPPAITVGVGIFVRYKLKDWQYYGTLAVAFIGACAALALLVEVGSITTARRFWAYSPTPSLSDYDAFVGPAQTALALILGWLVSLVLIQVGLKPKEGQ
jgi:hypothetical protein